MDDVPAFCKTCEVNSPYFIHHVNKGVLIVWCESGSYVCHIISLSGSYVSYHMIIWNLCIIWYPYLEIMYHILFLSGSYMSYHMFIWKLCIKFYKVPQLCIWSACTKWGEWLVMYKCARCIDFASVSMIFWLDLEVIWHLSYFLFFILRHRKDVPFQELYNTLLTKLITHDRQKSLTLIFLGTSIVSNLSFILSLICLLTC